MTDDDTENDNRVNGSRDATARTPDRTQPRDGNGRYRADPTVARRDADMMGMAVEGASYREIADTFGVSVSTAHCAIDRHLASITAPNAELLREKELARLEAVNRKLWEALNAVNFVVSDGKIVRDEDGQPLIDYNPNVSAAQALIRLSARRGKVMGIDAPARAEVSHILANLPIDTLDAEIRRLEAEVAEQRAIGGGDG